MRQIEQADIDAVGRMMRAIYAGSSPSVSREDFEAAGMLGLVRAAHEFDEARGGWVTLFRWRAKEQASQLLEWTLRTEADASLNRCVVDYGGILGKPKIKEPMDDVASVDPEPPVVQQDAIIAALRHVTGNIKRAIACAAWLYSESVESLAERFGVSRHTVHSHISHAREQVAEALAVGRIDPALRGIGSELAAEYASSSRPRSRKRAAARVRQQARAAACRSDEQQRPAGGDGPREHQLVD